jgi:hypothetical protein
MSQPTCAACGHVGNPADPVNIRVDGPGENAEQVWLCFDSAACEERASELAGEVALEISKEAAP